MDVTNLQSVMDSIARSDMPTEIDVQGLLRREGLVNDDRMHQMALEQQRAFSNIQASERAINQMRERDVEIVTRAGSGVQVHPAPVESTASQVQVDDAASVEKKNTARQAVQEMERIVHEHAAPSYFRTIAQDGADVVGDSVREAVQGGSVSKGVMKLGTTLVNRAAVDAAADAIIPKCVKENQDTSELCSFSVVAKKAALDAITAGGLSAILAFPHSGPAGAIGAAGLAGTAAATASFYESTTQCEMERIKEGYKELELLDSAVQEPMEGEEQGKMRATQ
jgi:hypothetical protein